MSLARHLAGEEVADGELYSLAEKLVSRITGDDIRGVYAAVLKRSVRQATYSMQVLRAVFRWHGVVVPDNPLGRDTAGRDRTVLTQPKGNPAPIPPELLGRWWKAAVSAPSGVASDYYRFQLLTGCRGVETHGSKRDGYPPIVVRDVDRQGGRIVLRDTKDRSDHKLLLSRQTLEIVERNCLDKELDDPLFAIVDARKTLAWINALAGIKVQGHGLRATVASIAEELVSGGVLKRMMNHAVGGDVTLGHYVGKSEAQLRAGWQTVADFIDAATTTLEQKQPPTDRVRKWRATVRQRSNVNTAIAAARAIAA